MNRRVAVSGEEEEGGSRHRGDRGECFHIFACECPSHSTRASSYDLSRCRGSPQPGSWCPLFRDLSQSGFTELLTRQGHRFLAASLWESGDAESSGAEAVLVLLSGLGRKELLYREHMNIIMGMYPNPQITFPKNSASWLPLNHSLTFSQYL